MPLMRTNPAHNILSCQSAGLPRYFMSVFKQNQSRDAADAVLRTQHLLGISVHLGYTDKRLQHRRGLHEGWGHHLAWPAPWRPEIHHQRYIVVVKVSCECGRGELYRMAREQRLVTLPTIGFLVEPRSRHTIDRLTVRAYEVRGVAHGVRILQ